MPKGGKSYKSAVGVATEAALNMVPGYNVGKNLARGLRARTPGERARANDAAAVNEERGQAWDEILRRGKGSGNAGAVAGMSAKAWANAKKKAGVRD